jgi:hypothetical protein
MGPIEPLNQKQVHFCVFCQGPGTSKHHVLPRSLGLRGEGSKPITVRTCRPCHNDIHRFFTNLELGQTYNTVETLKPELERRKALCPMCGGQHWVCENHPAQPWNDGDGCCGAPGMPCLLCNKDGTKQIPGSTLLELLRPDLN